VFVDVMLDERLIERKFGSCAKTKLTASFAAAYSRAIALSFCCSLWRESEPIQEGETMNAVDPRKVRSVQLNHHVLLPVLAARTTNEIHDLRSKRLVVELHYAASLPHANP